MGHLQRNIFANLIGRAWAKILGLVFIPLYIKFLGIEAFGLVGFYMTLASVSGLFDFGLSVTLNRELARLSALEGKAQEQRDLLRTMAIIYWLLALVLGALVFWLAPLIAGNWLNPQSLSVGTVTNGVRLMGLALVIEFPFNFYQYGMMGMQRQVLLNGILGTVTAAQGVGAVLLLWLVSPTIECFFIWQIIIKSLGSWATMHSLWHSLPAAPLRARFRKSLLRGISGFALGWAGFNVTQAIAFQADRVVLSRLLPMHLFGYYVLAQTIGMALWGIVESINLAAFPKLSQLVVMADEIGLKHAYHRACQVLAVILMPVAVITTLFSWELVLLWTRNQVIADNVHQIASLLLIGIMLRGIGSMPFCLQMAYGWFRLTLFTSFLSAICFIPLIILLAKWYGALGGAAATAIQHFVFFLAMPFMHYRYLRGEQSHWLLTDFLLPLAVVLIVAGTGRLLYPPMAPPLLSVGYLATLWLLTTGAAALLVPETRNQIIRYIGLKTETKYN